MIIPLACSHTKEVQTSKSRRETKPMLPENGPAFVEGFTERNNWKVTHQNGREEVIRAMGIFFPVGARFVFPELYEGMKGSDATRKCLAHVKKTKRKAFVREKIKHKSVFLVPPEREKLKRTFKGVRRMYIYFYDRKKKKTGKDLIRTMLKNGLVSINPNLKEYRKRKQYLKTQQTARRNRVGVWSCLRKDEIAKYQTEKEKERKEEKKRKHKRKNVAGTDSTENRSDRKEKEKPQAPEKDEKTEKEQLANSNAGEEKIASREKKDAEKKKGEQAKKEEMAAPNKKNEKSPEVGDLRKEKQTVTADEMKGTETDRRTKKQKKEEKKKEPEGAHITADFPSANNYPGSQRNSVSKK